MKRITVLTIVFLICILVIPWNVSKADPALPLPRIPFCGDQDSGGPPLVQNCPEFTPLTDVQLYQVQSQGQITLTFDFVFREASYNNEMVLYRADSTSGRIGTLNPGDAGYLDEVYKRSQIIFNSGSNASTPDVNYTATNGDVLIFYIIQSNTLENLKKNNPGNEAGKSPLAFFSLDVLNPDKKDHFVGYQHNAGDYSQFGFEDMTNGGDNDFDDVVYNISPPLKPTLVDSDGDALPDDWELNGLDTDRDGVRDLDLKSLGADPAVKDIFVEIDWLEQSGDHSHKPSQESIDTVIQAFARENIHLHVILDEAIEENAENRELIYFPKNIFGYTNGQNNADFIQLRKQYFLDNGTKIGKASVFHYAVAGHYIGDISLQCPRQSFNPAGIAIVSDLIMGLQVVSDRGEFSSYYEAYVLMHELGHTLGLGHGGIDENMQANSVNNKPNHLSIMNYSFAHTGLIKDGVGGILDYSHFDSSELADLNENGGLDEQNGLAGTGTVAGYTTRYYCSANDKDGTPASVATGNVDWNCNGRIDTGSVSANINKDSVLSLFGCSDVLDPPLRSYDEWSRLQFGNGAIGVYVDLQQDPPTEIPLENPEPELPPEVLLGSGYYIYFPLLMLAK